MYVFSKLFKKAFWGRYVGLLGAVMLISSCALYEPSLVDFTATPATVRLGEQTVLRWTTSIDTGSTLPKPGVTSYQLMLLPDNVNVTKFSSYLVAPQETTTYTLRLSYEGKTSVNEATVTVLPVNSPPTAAPLSVSTVQNETVSFTLRGDDPDGDPLSFSLVRLPRHGTLGALNETSGQLSYTPGSGFEGQDTFTFTVSDGSARSAEATVLISVGTVPGELSLFINTPEVGDSYTTSDTVVLSASALDSSAGDLSARVRWRSSLDGDLGTGQTLRVRLSRGVHTLSASVSNDAGDRAEKSVELSVAGPWTRQLGSDKIDVGYAIATDPSGNLYVTGYTGGELGGPSAGFDDLFLVKYDPEGTLLWKKQLGTTALDIARGVATDPSGNVFVTGYKSNLDGTNVGGYDLFLSKFDAEGNLLWTQAEGTVGTDHAYGVAVDSGGNAYVTGLTDGSLAGDNAGESDVYLLKYGPDGAPLWRRQFGSSHLDYARGVAVDSDDNVYVTGYTAGDLGGPNRGANDIFIAKFASDGEQLWVRQVAASTSDVAYGVATGSDGSSYIAGYTEGSVGGNELFIMKFSGAGDNLWTRQLGSADTDFARGVATDAEGNVYVSGYTDGSLDGKPSAGDFDIFFVKYSPDGEKKASWQLGTLGSDYAYGVATDAEGNAFVTGSTQGDLDGNVSAGGPDMFVVKFDVYGNKQ